MLLPTLWLDDYCDPGLDVGALEERLTMTGTKVERVLHARRGRARELRGRPRAVAPSSTPTPTG